MTQLSLIHRTRPATAGKGPYPGLVLLHGLGSNELDLHMISQQLDPRIFAISARAPLENPWGGYMWYDLAEGPGLGGRSIESGLERLQRFLDEVLQTYPIDPSRLCTGGFSMGAAMAGAVALLRPDRVTGAVMISGYLPPPSRERHYPSSGAAGHAFFQSHGTFDRVVSIDDARRTRDFLVQHGVALTYREYPIGHEVSLEELRELASWLDSTFVTPRDSVSS